MFEDNGNEECQIEHNILNLTDTFECMIENLNACYIYNLNVTCFKDLLKDLKLGLF